MLVLRLVILSVIGLLAGGALVPSRKVYALFTVIPLASFIVAAVGLLNGETIWSVAAAIAVVVVSIELGYLGGVLLQLRSSGARSALKSSERVISFPRSSIAAEGRRRMMNRGERDGGGRPRPPPRHRSQGSN